MKKRTIKWKNSIDDSARLKDDSLLPCLLIENKIDLVTEEEIKNDIEIKEFTKNNNFLDIFRCSAKQGININEAMDYILSYIISKQEEINSNSQNIVNDKDKGSIVLDGKNFLKKSKNGCC